jgi:hypothetical protein
LYWKAVNATHASDDKVRFVRGFAPKLMENGVDVWLDEWEISERELRLQVAHLKRVVADKTLEADFFNGALQKVEARRQSGTKPGETASQHRRLTLRRRPKMARPNWRRRGSPWHHQRAGCPLGGGRRPLVVLVVTSSPA